MFAISATREELPNEIIPLSAENSKTWDDREKFTGASAIDLNLGTWALIVPDSDGKTWLKVNLAEVHCIEKVIWYGGDGNPWYTWNCNSNDCSCSEGIGSSCDWYLLTTSVERASSDDLTPIAGCSYGDTVMLERVDENLSMWAFEIAIVGM